MHSSHPASVELVLKVGHSRYVSGKGSGCLARNSALKTDENSLKGETQSVNGICAMNEIQLCGSERKRGTAA